MTGAERQPGLRTGLLLLPLLLVAGRFLPGTWTWSINHLAYLPGWFTLAWIAFAVVLTLGLSMRARAAAGAIGGPMARFLFESRTGRVAVPPAGGILFWALGRHSHFLGDATWLGSSIPEGRPFHYFNFLDYHLHYRIYQALHGRVSAFTIYQVGSILAGILALAIIPALLRRLSWEPWRRVAAFGLLALYPPVALYFGYIESYAFSFTVLTAFLLTSLLVLDGRAPLWSASLLFGLACSLQLGSIFSAPALLVLARHAPGLGRRARWVQSLAVPAACFLAAVGLYVALGYNIGWFRREFLQTQFGNAMFTPWRGAQGLFSLYHWKDLANEVLITAPVPVLILATRWRRLRPALRRPPALFLMVQILSVALARLFLEAKLGGAKDWDLVAAHAAGLPLMAAMLIPSDDQTREESGSRAAATAPVPSPAAAVIDASAHAAAPAPDRSSSVQAHPAVAPALGAALLLTIPWIALPNFEDRSITRLIDVTADAPDWVRTYHLEDLGKFYRERGDLARADRLYAQCVEISPQHARLQVQLGWIRYREGRKELAERSYREAARLDSTLVPAAQMLGRLAAERGDLREAERQFARWTRLEPGSTEAWGALGNTAFDAQDWPEAIRGLARVLQSAPKDPDLLARLGLAFFQENLFADAAQAFRRSLAIRPGVTANRIGLAWALVKAIESGQAPDPGAKTAWLAEARTTIGSLVAENPNDPEIRDVARAVEGLP